MSNDMDINEIARRHYDWVERMGWLNCYYKQPISSFNNKTI